MSPCRLVFLLAVAAVSGCGSTEVYAPIQQANAPVALVAAAYPSNGGSPRLPKRDARIRRSSDGLFYVSARVNGVRVRFVVDSGSSTVVLSRSDAERAGISRSDEGTLLQTAGGVTRMQRTQLEEVAIANRALKNVEAAVVDEGLEVSLLGQSALSRLDAVHFSGDVLELR